VSIDLEPNQFYRLPWSLTDNAISWLEPTAACNMTCEGCYRPNGPTAHKSLERVKEELDLLRKLRRSDGVSVAGGDPLVHPKIVEIVRLISETGQKPILNTNGSALDGNLLRELKAAGVAGFTFHIDSKQRRPEWRGKNEIELNELRLHYARMLAEVGNISCSFNATVFPDTIDYVPDIVGWGQEHIDIVQTLAFITYRSMRMDAGFDYYIRGCKVDISSIVYSSDGDRRGDWNRDILSNDVVEVIRRRYPEFEPCAYLGGTVRADSFKWLLTIRMGTKDRIYGHVGARFAELIQVLHHVLYGSYLAYARPKTHRRGWLFLLFAPFDRGLRRILRHWLQSSFKNPPSLFRRIHLQSVMIIQPADIQDDGRLNMCDGCPDITVWEDKLIWSCRMDELSHFGCYLRAFPVDKAAGGGINEEKDLDLETGDFPGR